MSSQALTPVSSATKRVFLPSSSPLSSLFGSKRAKLSLPSREVSLPVDGSTLDSQVPVAGDTSVLLECIFAGVDHDEDDCTGACFENFNIVSTDDSQSIGIHQADANATSEVVYISSDPPEADEDSSSVWSMHPVTSENMETDTAAVNIAADIGDVFFHRGDDRRIGETDYPTVIYINRVNGKVYQSVVNRELFFLKRDLFGFDERALWLQTNIYIGALMDKCVNESLNPIETYPILHRHGNNTEITDNLVGEFDASSDLKHAVRREWARLITRYGELNDIQQEQKELIDRAFFLLKNYQRAVVSRDLVDLFKINDLLGPLREALNELALNEYVIRELFFRDTKPQFIDAISIL